MFWPRLPVLYMSGHTFDAIVHSGCLDEGVNYMEKREQDHEYLPNRRVEPRSVAERFPAHLCGHTPPRWLAAGAMMLGHMSLCLTTPNDSSSYLWLLSATEPLRGSP